MDWDTITIIIVDLTNFMGFNIDIGRHGTSHILWRTIARYGRIIGESNEERIINNYNHQWRVANNWSDLLFEKI